MHSFLVLGWVHVEDALSSKYKLLVMGKKVGLCHHLLLFEKKHIYKLHKNDPFNGDVGYMMCRFHYLCLWVALIIN